MADEGEGYAGRAIQWSVFVRPHISLKQRLKGASHETEVEHLGEHIREALKSEQISVGV